MRIGCIAPNTVYDQFQKKKWVADNRVELDGIRMDAGDIYLTVQGYEKTPGIYWSGMVYILYCDNHPQVQIHTQLVHRNISMAQISWTAERHTSTRNKSPSPSQSQYGNDLQRKLNCGKEYNNNTAEKVLF